VRPLPIPIRQRDGHHTCMERIHFEVSAINHAVNGGWSAVSLRQRMAGCGQIPVLGLQAICELAKTFLDPRGTDRGKSPSRCGL
jgi:hypothetical protein